MIKGGKLIVAVFLLVCFIETGKLFIKNSHYNLFYLIHLNVGLGLRVINLFCLFYFTNKQYKYRKIINFKSNNK